jgi:hypothetical protein
MDNLKDPSILLDKKLNLIVAVDDNLEQYMFTADSLFGTWSEAKNYKRKWGNETRPGGRFFEIDNQWYLPVQNRVRGYGTGISLYRLGLNQNKLALEPAISMFLKPQKEIKWFSRGMHHLDIQQVDNHFYMVYDGDRHLNNEMEFQYKRTIKFNFTDLYNYFFR